MPKYAKFLKELLSNQRKLEELFTITLSEQCFVILQNKLPKKLKDPRVFTLPYLIGSLLVEKALANLKGSEIMHDDSLELYLVQGKEKSMRLSIKDPT